MKWIVEQFGGAFVYAVAGSSICGVLLWTVTQLSSF